MPVEFDYDIFSAQIGMDDWMNVGGPSLQIPELLSVPIGSTGGVGSGGAIGGGTGGVTSSNPIATSPFGVETVLGDPVGNPVNMGDALSGSEVGAIIAYGKKTFSDTTAGWIQGLDTDGIYKWIIGDSASSIDWAVTTAATLTILGTITATSGTIGGFTIGASTIEATNLILTSGASNVANISVGTGSNTGGLNSAAAGSDIVFWAGATHANRATAPFRVTADGNATAIDLSGPVSFTAGEDLAVGNVVFLGSDGQVWKATAKDSVIASRVIGVCSNAPSEGGSAEILQTGNLTTTGLTTGSVYYLQDGLTTDTSQTGANNVNYEVYSNVWLCQTVTVESDGTIIGINVKFEKVGAPTGTLSMSIQNTSGGSPIGGASDISSVATMSATDVGTGSFAEFSFYFDTPVTAEDGDVLNFVLRLSDGDASNKIYWSSRSSNPYATGSGYQSSDSGANWSINTNVDRYFEVLTCDGSIGTSAGTVSTKIGIAYSTTQLNLRVS